MRAYFVSLLGGSIIMALVTRIGSPLGGSIVMVLGLEFGNYFGTLEESLVEVLFGELGVLIIGTW